MAEKQVEPAASTWQPVQVVAWMGVAIWSLTFLSLYVHLWAVT